VAKTTRNIYISFLKQKTPKLFSNKTKKRKERNFFFFFDGNGDGSLQNKQGKNNMKNIGKFEALENFKRKNKREDGERERGEDEERGIRGMYMGQKEMGP
jgi:hypothetical protein